MQCTTPKSCSAIFLFNEHDFVSKFQKLTDAGLHFTDRSLGRGLGERDAEEEARQEQRSHHSRMDE